MDPLSVLLTDTISRAIFVPIDDARPLESRSMKNPFDRSLIPSAIGRSEVCRREISTVKYTSDRDAQAESPFLLLSLFLSLSLSLVGTGRD